MNSDALTAITAGICFLGLGLSARKKNLNSKWKAYVCGGAVLLLIGLVALCFGLMT
jgi:hypothetical protein